MTFALFVLYLALTYLNPGEIEPGLAPYRITFWVGVAGLVSAAVSLLASGGRRLTNLQLWTLLVFTAVMALSLMVAERWPGAPLLVLQRFGPSLTIFVLAISSITSIKRLRIAAACVIALTTLLMLQGAAAFHFGYNASRFLLGRPAPSEDLLVDEVQPADYEGVEQTWDAGSEDERRDRARIQALGFMQDPNDLALAMIVALGLIAGTWRPTLQPRQVLLALTAFALVYGVYLTRSRGGAVALVVVLWRYVAIHLGRVPGFFVLLTLASGVVALDFGGRTFSMDLDESTSERLVAWTEGLEMLKASPILGVGYGQFLEHHTLTAHNSLILCVAETGLLGGFFWVGMFVVTALELRRLANSRSSQPLDDAARRWATGLQLSVTGFIVAAFFLSRTFVPTIYLIVGLAASLVAIARSAGRPVRLPPLPHIAALVLASELASIGIVYLMVKLHVA